MKIDHRHFEQIVDGNRIGHSSSVPVSRAIEREYLHDGYTPAFDKAAGWAVLLIFSPFFLAVAGGCILFATKRAMLGPTGEWDRWFAWRPVVARGSRADGHANRLAWMTFVERRLDDETFGSLYRKAGSDWEPRSPYSRISIGAPAL